jgi:hypothetical protein
MKKYLHFEKKKNQKQRIRLSLTDYLKLRRNQKNQLNLQNQKKLRNLLRLKKNLMNAVFAIKIFFILVKNLPRLIGVQNPKMNHIEFTKTLLFVKIPSLLSKCEFVKFVSRKTILINVNIIYLRNQSFLLLKYLTEKIIENGDLEF